MSHMEITYNDKYLQLSLRKDNPVLAKIIIYANKHFAKQYKLSSSILILDSAIRRKKDYLITWAYHMTLQEDLKLLDDILQRTHLPIRIKILGFDEVLNVINIKLSNPSLSRAVLHLAQDNHIAKRYLLSTFKGYCIDYSVYQNGGAELVLDSAKGGFYERLINTINYKIIHNVVLDFDFKTFIDAPTYITAREIELQKILCTLNAEAFEDFESIKKKYLKLVRQFHPDRVFGEDEGVIKAHTRRFQEINEAYSKYLSLIS